MRLNAYSVILVAYAALIASLADAGAADLRVISFNIQFLGNSEIRRDEELVDMLARYDLIFVQELVAPPYEGTFPDGAPFNPDLVAREFFDAMTARNFEYVLSVEDTGRGQNNHNNGSATEWFVAFYKPTKVAPAEDLFTGFLAADRTANPDYDRVPHAFAFQAGKADLVFISVHLRPGDSAVAAARRAHELDTIHDWIAAQPGTEGDYVILGDMNFKNCAERDANISTDQSALDQICQATNIAGGRPYDQIIYDTDHSTRELRVDRGLTVLNLTDEMELRWPSELGAFPTNPDQFRMFFSDHHPVLFTVRTNRADDD